MFKKFFIKYIHKTFLVKNFTFSFVLWLHQENVKKREQKGLGISLERNFYTKPVVAGFRLEHCTGTKHPAKNISLTVTFM